MLMAYLTLFSGLLISGVAIFYSVAGLTAIFSAAVWPIIIMGVSLEVGKLVATVWVKQNWTIAPRLLKGYLLIAITILMVITSLGIFGYLSKAHSDQSLVSGDVQSKIAIYDEKIKTAKDNIEANRKALKQMDEAVDQVMGRSSDEKGAERAVGIRRSQQKERARLQSEIASEQKIVAAISEERAPIAAEVRKVEAEVGPIKYIAAFVYGDNPDASILEKAVTWVIILIVVVFDPLAVMLLLASQYSFALLKKKDDDTAAMAIVPPDDEDSRPFTQEEVAALDKQPEPVIKESFEGIKDSKTGEWIQTGPSFEYIEPQIEEQDIDLEEWYAYANELEQEKTKADAILQQGVTNSKPEDNMPLSEKTIDYQILDDDSEEEFIVITPHVHETGTDNPIDFPKSDIQITHTADGMLIEDSAGMQEITVEPAKPVITPIGNDYVSVNGQIYHHKAFDSDSTDAGHIVEKNAEPEKTYVQNEEQNESNVWTQIANKTITEEEYLKAIQQKQKGLNE
jgi:hypothetical protein